MLVPSDNNPPETEKESEKETVIEKSKLVEKVDEVEEVVETEKITQTVTEKETVKTTEKTSGKIKEITSLEKGKWYIQIAAYKNIDNVNEIYSKYGKKYPVVVEKRGDISVVMIGPLSMDEYGTVLQRFKAFGFKDAFVKKGK